jgi:hypothetical protein
MHLYKGHPAVKYGTGQKRIDALSQLDQSTCSCFSGITNVMRTYVMIVRWDIKHKPAYVMLEKRS